MAKSKRSATCECRHCGTPFEQEAADQHFCCSGCSFVHGLIADNGLDRFYHLKGTERLLPAGNQVLAPQETSWATSMQAALETDVVCAGATVEAKLDLQGVSCVACVWLIDALFQQQPGAARIFVDTQRGEVTMKWFAGEFDLPTFVSKLGQFGYRLAPASTEPRKEDAASGLRLGLCGGLMLNAMAFTLPRYLGMEKSFALAGIFELIAAASATISLATGGSFFIKRAWSAIRLRRLHVDVPIAGGIVAAWLGSLVGWVTHTTGLLYFDFVATFIFLMLLGRRLQEASVNLNRSRLLRSDPMLQAFSVKQDGAWKELRVDALEIGQEVKIPSGGVLPVDAELLDQSGTISQEWINGEAESLTVGQHAGLPAGAVNLAAGTMHVRVTQRWEGSLLQRLSKSDRDEDNPAARFLDKLLRVYLSIVVLLAASGFALWTWKQDWTAGLQVGISVLVVSCPCALGVALPMAHELAVARLRRGGLFVRAADIWGRLLRIRKIVFDKTGTLTLDAPALRNPQTLTKLTPPAVAALSALVSRSRHPISASLRHALAGQNLFTMAGNDGVEEIPGYGVKMRSADGLEWALRRPDVAEDAEAVFTCEGTVVAKFHFTEAIRPDAVREVEMLHRRGFPIFLLSGDREEKVNAMAAALGVPANQALARCSPDDKSAWMKKFGQDALFVGDGANDSLAADQSLVRGTPAVERSLLAEKADFYFLSRGLRPVRTLIETALLRRQAVLSAFTFALLYNASAVALSLGGKMNPLLAAILMPLSSVVTLLIVGWRLRDAGGRAR